MKTISKMAMCILCACVLLTGCKKNESGADCLTASTDHPVVNQSITFTDCMSGAISAAWDFGDGTIGSGIIVVKTYAAAGTYTVRLISTSTGGQTKTVTKQVAVSIPSSASFTYGACSASYPFSTYIYAGDSVFFAAAAGAASYLWNFGDGSTSTIASPVHIFSRSSTVSLRVTNQAGAVDSSFQLLTLANPFGGMYSFVGSQIFVDTGASFAPGSSFVLRGYPPPSGNTTLTITTGLNFVINRQTVYVVTGSPNTPATISGYGHLSFVNCSSKEMYLTDSIVINNGGPLYSAGTDTLYGHR